MLWGLGSGTMGSGSTGLGSTGLSSRTSSTLGERGGCGDGDGLGRLGGHGRAATASSCDEGVTRVPDILGAETRSR